MQSGGMEPAEHVVRDPRSAEFKAICQRFNILTLERATQLDSELIEGLILKVGADPGFRQRELGILHQRRLQGRVHDPVYQSKIKAALAEQWVLLTRSGIAGTAMLDLRSLLYPHESTESFMDIIEAELGIVSQMTLPGTTTTVGGHKGTGKTDTIELCYQYLHGIFKDIQDNGKASRFWRAKRRATRKPPDEFDDEIRSLEDEASIGPNNLTDENHSEWAVKLGLFHAKGVQQVTNVDIFADSPLIETIRQCSAMSAIMLRLLDGDESSFFSYLYFDEAAAVANRARMGGNTEQEFLQLSRTNRKDNSTLVLATPDVNRAFPDEIVEAAETRITKLMDGSGRGTRGLFKIQGMREEKLLENIPRTIVHFDTQARGAFWSDVAPMVIWKQVGQERALTLAGKGNWTHADSIRCARELIKKRASAKDIAEGRSDMIAESIKQALRETDFDTGLPKTTEQVADEVSDDYGIDLPIERVEEISKLMRLEEEEAEKRKGKLVDPEVLAESFRRFREA